jgi:DNA-binding transcriptional LysR family regulator
LDRVVNLLDERIDLALRIGDLPDSTLRATRVGSIRRIVCASPRYLAKRGAPATPDELREHDCVTFEGFAGSGTWMFGTAKKPRGVVIRSRLVVNTPEAAVDAAVAGLGLTRVLSYQAELAMRAGALQIALREFEPAPWPVSLVYAGGRFLPLKVRAFIDFAAPRLKAALAGDA